MTLSARGNALYHPDGPASTSTAAQVSVRANGPTTRSGHHYGQAQHHTNKFDSGHIKQAEQKPAASDPSEDQALHRPKRRGLPLPSGLTEEQYDLIRESPFLDLDSPMTAYEWFKLVVFLPALLIRCLLIAILMPPCWLFARLIILGARPNEPLPPWKVALIRPFARFWALILLFVGMSFYFSLKGKENITQAIKVCSGVYFQR